MPQAIPPLGRHPRSVAAELAAHLEQLITGGSLAPGERLPSERELAAQLNVSRASLRQAMFELESKQLIERRQGRGSIVREPATGTVELHVELSELDVEQANATELRDLVEPRIADLAARRAAPSNLLRMEDVLAQSNENLDAAVSLRLDREFHLLLAYAAQNPLLVTLCEITSKWTEALRALSHATREGRRISIEGHRAIYAAVVNRDGESASAAMVKHLADVRELISNHQSGGHG